MDTTFGILTLLNAVAIATLTWLNSRLIDEVRHQSNKTVTLRIAPKEDKPEPPKAETPKPQQPSKPDGRVTVTRKAFVVKTPEDFKRAMGDIFKDMAGADGDIADPDDDTEGEEWKAIPKLPFKPQAIIRCKGVGKLRILLRHVASRQCAHGDAFVHSPNYDNLVDEEEPQSLYFKDIIDAHLTWDAFKKELRCGKARFVADHGEIRLAGGGTIEITDL